MGVCRRSDPVAPRESGIPESVDSPAPESTTTSPSPTSSARASRRSAGAAPVASGAVGAAVTVPWSLVVGARAGAAVQLALQPTQQVPMDPLQALRGEGALEEAADAAGAVPRRA